MQAVAAAEAQAKADAIAARQASKAATYAEMLAAYPDDPVARKEAYKAECHRMFLVRSQAASAAQREATARRKAAEQQTIAQE